MSKSVRRFLLGNLWDFGKNESWFSDMALKGRYAFTKYRQLVCVYLNKGW